MAWTIDVPSTQRVDEGRVIGTLWAREMIRAIEDRTDTFREGRPAEMTDADRTKLIGLSKQFGLVTGLTSYIAIEHRSAEERNEGKPELRRVPVMIAKDWGGTDSRHRTGGFAAMACAPRP
ncbi:MAG: hypothetical protein QM770_02385 [Tepidisphaeraceae bacterium]